MFGSSEPSLILFIPSIFCIASSKSINLVLLSKSIPYDATCIPVITTSFIPFAAISVISFTTLSNFLLLTLPFAYGIMQYEQKLLHPSCTFITALVFSVYVTLPKSTNSFCLFMSDIFTLSRFLLSLYSSTIFTMSFFSVFPTIKSMSVIFSSSSFAVCA